MKTESIFYQKSVIVMGIGITALVVFTFIFYMLAQTDIGLFEYLSVPIIIIILLTSIFIINDKYKNLKAGLPSQDERLKLAAYKAGYFGFFAAVWSAIGVNMGSIMLTGNDLRGGLVVAAVVLVSGLTFMGAYFYFSRKGNLE